MLIKDDPNKNRDENSATSKFDIFANNLSKIRRDPIIDIEKIIIILGAKLETDDSQTKNDAELKKNNATTSETSNETPKTVTSNNDDTSSPTEASSTISSSAEKMDVDSSNNGKNVVPSGKLILLAYFIPSIYFIICL